MKWLTCVYVFTVLFIGGSNTTDYCNVADCGIHHIGCNNSGALHPDCPKGTQIVNMGPHKEIILYIQNNERNKLIGDIVLTYPQAVMAELQWDDELAELAQLTSNKCKMENNDCLHTKRLYHIGQNIGSQSYCLTNDDTKSVDINDINELSGDSRENDIDGEVSYKEATGRAQSDNVLEETITEEHAQSKEVGNKNIKFNTDKLRDRRDSEKDSAHIDTTTINGEYERDNSTTEEITTEYTSTDNDYERNATQSAESSTEYENITTLTTLYDEDNTTQESNWVTTATIDADHDENAIRNRLKRWYIEIENSASVLIKELENNKFPKIAYNFAAPSIHPKATHIGCGAIRYKNESCSELLLVCHYGINYKDLIKSGCEKSNVYPLLCRDSNN